MRPRTLLILLLLVAGLGGFAWFVDRDLPGSEERAEKAKQVLHFDAEGVVALRIERGDQTVRLEASRPAAGDGESIAPRSWRLVEPLQAPADNAKVRALLSDLGSLESQRTVELADRSALGLDSPRGRVALEREQGAEVVLEIGSAVPSSELMIVARSGETTAQVVADRLYEALEGDASTWRDYNLFHGERASVATIRISTADGKTVELTRRGGEMWLEKPVVDRAEGELVDRLLKALVELKAETFLDPPSALSPLDRGLQPPQATIEALAGDGSAILTLALGSEVAGEEAGSLPNLLPNSLPNALPNAPSSGRYARAGDQWVTLASGLQEWWTKPVKQWRSKSWASLEPWQVDDATIESPSGRLVLRRDGVDWHRDGVAIPFTSVSDLFAALGEIRALEVMPQRTSGELGKPVMTVVLASSEGEEERLALYAPTSPNPDAPLAATVSGREVVLSLPAETLAKLESKLAAIRGAEPLPRAELDKADDLLIEAEEGS